MRAIQSEASALMTETVLPRLARLAESGLVGTLKVEVAGQPYYLRLDGGVEVLPKKPARVDAILRAQLGDLSALLAGRMSWADGLLTERIGVAGEVSFLARLGALIDG